MYISTHIHYWPTRRSKTIHPRALRLSISGALFSVVSLFETIMAPEIQIDFCIANGHAGCNMMSFDNSVKNKPDIFRLTPFKRGKNIRIENKAKFVIFWRFLGYGIYQRSNSNTPHTQFTVIFSKSMLFYFFTSVGHL